MQAINCRTQRDSIAYCLYMRSVTIFAAATTQIKG